MQLDEFVSRVLGAVKQGVVQAGGQVNGVSLSLPKEVQFDLAVYVADGKARVAVCEPVSERIRFSVPLDTEQAQQNERD